MLIDVHAHLADPVFDRDRDAVIRRAAAAGIGRVMVVGETLADARRILSLSVVHPEIMPALGVHPTVLDIGQSETVGMIIREQRRKLFAIGEIGLDYWKVQDPAARGIQRDIFAAFIKLGIELDLPLNVHSRSAGADTIAMLIEYGARRVIMHAYDGRWVTARDAVLAGYFFSVPPSVARSRQKQKLVRQLPLECLLLETDSPVLGPAPDERNEPANAVIALNAIAEIKNLDVTAVKTAVMDNQQRCFNLPIK